ncbi:uncharacterized protein At2g39795, mitochondrial-like [Macadamia integrifolia]|uniref:uncharacterized protein At2g39795, mitochondrial-like n=1 Tax=Macadamia integrifolia TaxID=60698 RepID=UPI001C4EF4DF|nr:uncharacterized protein At2g39795, mitochondrial-like [Macadamia integrifolia]
MVFSAIFRRAASSVAPLAVRAVAGTQRAHHAILLTSLKTSSVSQELCRRTFLPTLFNFSSVAKRSSSDDSLVRAIESEIKCAEESDDHNRVDEIPGGFPFEIQDNPGQQTVSLRREYQGEIIKVEVHMPDLVTGDVGNENDDDDDDSERSNQSSIPLVVSVSKGGNLCLEFGCTAYPDEMTIDSLSVKEPEASEDQIAYEGPDFMDLDENLQKAFHKYLEIRGIKPSTTNFLHEYMINKDSREYFLWLKNLKKFVEK